MLNYNVNTIHKSYSLSNKIEFNLNHKKIKNRYLKYDNINSNLTGYIVDINRQLQQVVFDASTNSTCSIHIFINNIDVYNYNVTNVLTHTESVYIPVNKGDKIGIYVTSLLGVNNPNIKLFF